MLSYTVVLYKCIPCSGMAGCVTINTCSISLQYSIATGMYEGVLGGVACLGQGCCCVYVHMCGMCPRVYEGTCCGIGTYFLIPHDGGVASLGVCGGC